MADLIQELVSALRCLPGVGPKSGQRMAYHLLERDRGGARRLSEALLAAVERIGHCRHCRTLCQDDACSLCSDQRRDATQLCIVETPSDIHALEQAGGYRGHYFVLMGHLSPLDGIGPEELGLDTLQTRFDQGIVSEVILATNPTVEGEATAHYIAGMAQDAGLRATRIAYGVPFGGELEYMDAGTLTHALSGRRNVDV